LPQKINDLRRQVFVLKMITKVRKKMVRNKNLNHDFEDLQNLQEKNPANLAKIVIQDVCTL
jgi:hypothetical protein